MNKTARIVIVVVLIVTVIALLFFKQNQSKTDILNTETNISNQETKSELPVLLELGADKCVPCKMMAPILDELEVEYKGQFEVRFIDVWKNPDEAKKYNIKLIPTQVFFDIKGNEQYRHEGFFSKSDILEKWEELGVEIPDPK